MTRALVALAIAAALAGCTQLQTRAAAIADDLGALGEFQLCRAMTVGAWVRAYGAEPKKAEAWRTLCTSAPAQTPGATP